MHLLHFDPKVRQSIPQMLQCKASTDLQRVAKQPLKQSAHTLCTGEAFIDINADPHTKQHNDEASLTYVALIVRTLQCTTMLKKLMSVIKLNAVNPMMLVKTYYP